MSADLERYFDTMQRNHDVGTAIHKASISVASAITRHVDTDFDKLYDAIESVLQDINTNADNDER